jgi:hypothetical protein
MDVPPSPEATPVEFTEPPASDAPPADEPPVTPEEADLGSSPDEEEPAPRRTTLIGLSLLAVVLVAILVAVLVTGGGDDGPSVTTSPTTVEAKPPGPTLPEAAFKSFHDDATGFSIKYPASWPLSQAPVSEIRFVATPGPGQGEAVSVRVNDTEQVTTAQNLANIKSVTDGTIASNASARILKTDVITLNGLLGYYYLYTFKDSSSGLEGVHAHYFLFKGNKMYSMVFQVLPSERFAEFAGMFDQMAESFKVDP